MQHYLKHNRICTLFFSRTMYQQLGLLFLFISTPFLCNAQEDNALWGLYKQDQNSEVIESFHSEYGVYKTDAAAHNIVSRAHYALKDYDSTRYYAEKSIYLDGDKSVIADWSHVFLGYAFYFTNQPGMARDEMYLVIRRNANEYCTRSANAFLNITNILPSFKDWAVVEKDQIRFHFQKADEVGSYRYKRYMADHAVAYKKLAKTFEPVLTKKIDYYVWDDREAAKQYLQKGLGYSVPEVAVVNTAIDQTPGHEMTHVLSFWAWGQDIKIRTRLIDEGLAVCFDLSERGLDKISEGRVTVSAYKGQIATITDIWKQGLYEVNELFFLPVAGAFVHYLYENSTEEEFRSVVKNQTIEHAKEVYGDRFDQLINGFDKLMYLKRG